ncbi:hypothetical protein SPF06_09700 [Sinomonas sp. JGH33]|uniref:DUF559 domain-containing protein n=1 Tax=Sinomonas terricola TaxID=3110330 RepID=A0ABU5T632_9MICC|nr:hypothetical protein [Sinomonas sp. JGH33]MEA5454992.1 hypothetical protein [Sinomonas sp. JGH33]
MSARVRPFVEVNVQCAASHWTAAALFGLPDLSRGRAEGYHVIRPEGAAHLVRPHIVVHRAKLSADEVTAVEGMWVTTPARTWLDLAEMLPVDDIVVMGDACVRVPYLELEGRSEPYATIEELRSVVDRHKGKRGIRKARLALELIRIGADSPPETRLRLACMEAELPEPQLNLQIATPDGRRGPKPDIAFVEFRVGVEYEGEHHGSQDQVVRDITRSELYAEAGWLEVRISKRHMANDAKSAVAKVRTALAQRGWRPGRKTTAP